MPDSSNRYEHTCKLCGDNFPKGRPDSLLSHLTKSCQAISIADKQRVLHLLRGLPGGSGPRKCHGNGRQDQIPTSIPCGSRAAAFNGAGGLNGLNVLAEASRRVGATDDPGEQQQVSQEQKEIIVDPALESPTGAVIGEQNLRHNVCGISVFPANTELTLRLSLVP